MQKTRGAFFLSWPEAFQAGAAAAGGKGWNLGRLERYGFKVPAGGVLTAGAYQSFIEENNLVEDIRKITRSVTIDTIGKKEVEKELSLIREKIRNGHIPGHIQEELISSLKCFGILEKPLAVRSSATAEDSGKASFAGIHESFLNVIGTDNILNTVKGCYASLWTPRAVAYRRKMDIKDDEVIQAVVIMEMVQAEAAGVGFTCNPGTGQEGFVLVSANFGLGESVVSGAVEPDEYSMDHRYLSIKEKKIGLKKGKTIAGKDGGTEFVDLPQPSEGQVLTDESIRKLGLLILRVFDALGRGEQHQDIEWAFDGQDFVLVQARPVTALPRYTLDGLKDQPDIWSNANLRDAMPMVQSTLNWCIFKQLWTSQNETTSKNFSKMFGNNNQATGLRYIRLYQGRAYLNLSLFQWMFYDVLGITPRQMNETVGGHQPEIKINEKKPYRGIKGLKRLWRLLKLITGGQKMIKNANNFFDKVNVFTEAFLKENLKTLSDRELVIKSNEIHKTLEESPPVLFNPGQLIKTLEKYFPGKGEAMVNALMAGNGDITSAEQGYRLVEMAEIAREDAAARSFFAGSPFNPLLWEKMLPEESRFKRSFRDFLSEFGHRGVYECDIINPRWREDPSYLLHIIRSTMDTVDLAKIRTQQRIKAEQAWQEVNQRVFFLKRGLINSLLKKALKDAGLREMNKSVAMKIFLANRVLYKEIGRRLAERVIIAEQNDVFHCSLFEINSILQGDWDGKGLALLVAERKAWRKEMETLSPPDIIMDETPQYAEPAARGQGNALAGIGVASGRASGAARLIRHPEEGEKLQAGDVLVTPSTDPGWTPLFLRAAAIVVETGGFSSHGSIVAREYGIPAVVNIPGVMKMIKDSQLITVDGDEGKVYLGEAAGESRCLTSRSDKRR